MCPTDRFNIIKTPTANTPHDISTPLMTDRMCVCTYLNDIYITFFFFFLLRSVIVCVNNTGRQTDRSLQKRFYSTAAAPRVNIPTVSCHVRRSGTAKRNDYVQRSRFVT